MSRAAAVLTVILLARAAASAQIPPAPELPSIDFEGLKNSAQALSERAAIPDPGFAEAGKVPVSPGDQAAPAGLPAIGKWMLDSRGEAAHWLGRKVRGRLLDEPVNILIRTQAPLAALATRKVLAAAKAAGFTPRAGHTNGYSALLGGKNNPQEKRTFSDRPFIESNDHFRLFGPVHSGSFYYFSAAISREKVDPLPGPHEYVSFAMARDAFVRKMTAAGKAKLVGDIPLDNAIPNDGFQTTGDHDGAAALLELPGSSWKFW